MERYIIPFLYNSQNHYVFIDKHQGSKAFGITQLVPETDEVLDRQILVEEVRSFIEPASTESLNMRQTIIRFLAAYLQQKGWPIDESFPR